MRARAEPSPADEVAVLLGGNSVVVICRGEYRIEDAARLTSWHGKNAEPKVENIDLASAFVRPPRVLPLATFVISGHAVTLISPDVDQQLTRRGAIMLLWRS